MNSSNYILVTYLSVIESKLIPCHCFRVLAYLSFWLYRWCAYIRVQWWFVNPGSDNPEISLIRTKSAGTDFLYWTDGRFSNPENSLIRKYRPGTNVSGLTNHHCILFSVIIIDSKTFLQRWFHVLFLRSLDLFILYTMHVNFCKFPLTISCNVCIHLFFNTCN